MYRNSIGDVEGPGSRTSRCKGPVVRESTSEEEREGQDGWGPGSEGESGVRVRQPGGQEPAR